MNFKSQSNVFKKRWGILDKYDPIEEFEKFKRRILNIFDDIDRHVEERWVVKFCSYFGRRVDKSGGSTYWAKNIHGALESETDQRQFFHLVETIINLPIETKYSGSELVCSKNRLLCDLKEAVEISEINLMITDHDGKVILSPRGEELLDKDLVEEVFSFLNPESQQHMVAALKFYNQRNTKSYIKSSESIRRCIEEFLKFKLDNSRGLAENIKELGKRFKADKVAPEIRNIISQTFDCLDKFFNEHSKHNDGDIAEAENEYLLYQAGLLMRYIYKVI